MSLCFNQLTNSLHGPESFLRSW